MFGYIRYESQHLAAKQRDGDYIYKLHVGIDTNLQYSWKRLTTHQDNTKWVQSIA
jgi:hypothetical protein